MNAFGTMTYGAAAAAFLLLTVLLLASWQGRAVGGRLIVASAVSCVWALVLSAQNWFGRMPVFALYLAEMLRDLAWVWMLLGLAQPIVSRFMLRAIHIAMGVLLLAGIALPLFDLSGLGPDEPALLLSRGGLGVSLAGLMLLEQIYRNSSQSTRYSLRHLVFGVGALFAYDLFLYSQAELLRGIAADAWNARGIVNVICVPMIAIAARRNPQWALNIFISRQVIFHTATFAAVGAYLLLMSMGGYYVRAMGGTWGGIAQIVFFAGAIVVLASLISSGGVRRHAKVFISKHFYRNKYDYRLEWLRFIQTLSSSADDEDVRRTGLRAVAQILSSPGGILFTLDEASERFIPSATWPVRLDAVEGIDELRPDSDLVRFLVRTQWIVDLREYRQTPDTYQNIELPAWLPANTKLRIISPLLALDRLVGFFVLYDPPPPFELTYEDRDLLKTVGRHVATYVAQQDADRKLAESRQFEAYNRLTAFLMHDLKNSVAQLKLVVANADRHKHNPAFIEDAIGTIANTVERMTRLIEQLRGSSTSRARDAALEELAANAVARCRDRLPRPDFESVDGAVVRADPERLTAIIEHLIRNAQDASKEDGQVLVRVLRSGGQATLSVTDAGCGMPAEFVRERLFRPFDSTKGSKGMGIGAYQVREYVRILGGSVEVQSSPGRGTTFSITLPLAQQPPLSSAGKNEAERGDLQEAADRPVPAVASIERRGARAP